MAQRESSDKILRKAAEANYLLMLVEESEHLLTPILPPLVRLVHGDPHLGNVLVSKRPSAVRQPHTGVIAKRMVESLQISAQLTP